MSKENLILGVDLDGVCGDFYGCVRKLYAEWAEIPLYDLPEADSFSLTNWGLKDQKQYEDFHRFAVTQKGLFDVMPMIPGTRKYLKKLSDEGVRIRIVTHRLCIKHFHKEAIIQTANWLDRQGIPFWDLCFLKHKIDIDVDIFIEDTPHNIQSLRNSGIYTICFSNTTNIGVSPPRVGTWEEVYQLIGQYK